MSREYNFDIMPEIKTRYALRHFKDEKISREELMPIFEAARYAPSCFNEQPERYLVGDADAPQVHAKLAQSLLPGNAYAVKAPVLILVMATRNFKLNGSKNAWARFDTGTATAFLQLEAVRRGFGVHCMAGFDKDMLREAFNLSDDLDCICMIALGRPVPREELSEQEREKDQPGTRNALDTFILDIV